MNQDRHAVAPGPGRTRLGLVVCCLLAAVGCQGLRNTTVPEAPAVRLATWWNYYQRALELARQGQWAGAVEDFEQALGRRGDAIYGEDRDLRRARTYGLHFVNDYFPHRELGVCLFRLGRLDEAECELRTSLDMLASSRARAYLNQVREARLLAAPGRQAPGELRIDLRLPEGDLYLAQPALRLDGTVASPAYVAAVRVNGDPLFVELAQAELAVRRRVPLAPGRSTVTVTARDLAGRQATWQRNVVVDLAGPAVTVARSTAHPGTELILEVTDDVGLASVEVNGQSAPVADGQTRFRTALPAKSGDVLRVVATDRAGNRTPLEGPVSRWLLAARWRPTPAALRAGLREPPTANGVRLATAAPLWPLLLRPTQAAAADALPPRLTLAPEVGDQVAVTTECYVLDVQAEDAGGIASVVIAVNGKGETPAVQDRQATVQRFTRTLPLQPGANEVRIEVRDAAGNVATRVVSVERRDQAMWREDLRISTQVLPPRREAVPGLAGVDLYALLVEELMRKPRRLNLVERDPAVVQRLLLEMKLSESPVADYRKAMKLGKLKPAEWLVDGYVTGWPGQDNYDLVLQIVEAGNGELVLTTDIHFAGFAPDHVRGQLRGLVEKLGQQLPALSTTVAEVTGKGVKLAVGSRDCVAPGMRFVFLPAAAEDPDFADPVMWQNAWVQGRVTAVRESACLVEIPEAEARSQLKAKDWAIVR